MNFLAAVVLLAGTVAAFCPKSALESPNRPKCYTFFNWPKTFTQADTICRDYGGTLASISNAFEANILWEGFQDQGAIGNGFWIGANDLNQPGQFAWLDGTPFSYTRWSDGQPNSTNHCISTLAANGKWSTASCTTILPFACVADDNAACQSPCESEWTWNQNTTSCYKVFHDVRTFQDAEATCQGVGAHLTSIHNALENTFINSLSMSGSTMESDGQVWTGLNKNPQGVWQWSDGTAVDYFNWAQGEPSNTDRSESCVEAYSDLSRPSKKGDYQQKWNDCPCNMNMRAGVCKKAARKM